MDFLCGAEKREECCPVRVPLYLWTMTRVAVVTGGAVRLGRAISLGLAEAGYDIGVNYLTSNAAATETERRITELGRNAVLLPGDVSNTDDVARIASQIESRFGRLDLLVNSASVFFKTPLLEIEAEEWDQVMAVNLKGPHLMVRACADLLRNSQGSVVNLADHMGMRAWVRYAHHSVSKAGVMHLTRIMANALAPQVRVNAVAPGLVLPPADFSAEALEAEVQATALKRGGSPDDIVRTILFLADSPFITGEVVVVDGGRHLS